MVSENKRAAVRRVIEQSGLPSAPLIMPDQVLVRERAFLRFKPLAHWLAVR